MQKGPIESKDKLVSQVGLRIEIPKGESFESCFEEVIKTLAPEVAKLIHVQRVEKHSALQGGHDLQEDRAIQLAELTKQDDLQESSIDFQYAQMTIKTLSGLYALRHKAITLKPADEVLELKKGHDEPLKDEIFVSMIMSVFSTTLQFWNHHTDKRKLDCWDNKLLHLEASLSKLRLSVRLYQYLPKSVFKNGFLKEMASEHFMRIYEQLISITKNLSFNLEHAKFPSKHIEHLQSLHEVALISKIFYAHLLKHLQDKTIPQKEKVKLWPILLFTVDEPLAMMRVAIAAGDLNRYVHLDAQFMERHKQFKKIAKEQFLPFASSLKKAIGQHSKNWLSEQQTLSEKVHPKSTLVSQLRGKWQLLGSARHIHQETLVLYCESELFNLKKGDCVTVEQWKLIDQSLRFLKDQKMVGLLDLQSIKHAVSVAKHIVKILGQETLLDTLIVEEVYQFMSYALSQMKVVSQKSALKVEAVDAEVMVLEGQLQQMSLVEDMPAVIHRQALELSEQQIDSVQKQMTELQLSFEKEIEALRGQMVEVSAEHAKELEKAQARYLRGREALEKAMGSLKKKNANQKSEINRLLEKNAEDLANLKQAKKEVLEVQSTSQKQSKMLSATLSEKLFLEESLKETTLSLEHLESVMDILRKEKEALKSQAQDTEKLQESLEETASQLQASTEQCQALKFEKTEREHAQQILQSKLDEFGQANAKLFKIAKTLKQNEQEYILRDKAWHERLGQLSTEYKALESEYNNARAAIASLSQHVGYLDARVNAESQENLEALSAENEKLKEQYARQALSHQRIMDEIFNLRSENKKLSAQKYNLGQAYTQLQGELELRKQVDAVKSPRQKNLFVPFKASHLKVIDEQVHTCAVKVRLQLSPHIFDLMQSIEKTNARCFIHGECVTQTLSKRSCLSLSFVVCGDESKVVHALEGFIGVAPGLYIHPKSHAQVLIKPNLDLMAFSKAKVCMQDSMLISAKGIIVDPMQAYTSVESPELLCMQDFEQNLKASPLFAIRLLSVAFKLNLFPNTHVFYKIEQCYSKLLTLSLNEYMKIWPLLFCNHNPMMHMEYLMNKPFTTILPMFSAPLDNNQWGCMMSFFAHQLNDGAALKLDSYNLLSLMLLPSLYYYTACLKMPNEQAMKEVSREFCEMFLTPLSMGDRCLVEKRLSIMLPKWLEAFCLFEKQYHVKHAYVQYDGVQEGGAILLSGGYDQQRRVSQEEWSETNQSQALFRSNTFSK